MDNNITTNDQNSFDIKSILSKVLPRWYWFVLSLVVCLCYAYYNNLHIIPQYSCNATVMLKNNANPQRLVGLTALAPTTDIENEIGFALDWRELPDKKASRIIIEKPVNLDAQEEWNSQFDWIIDTCVRFKKAFKKYI